GEGSIAAGCLTGPRSTIEHSLIGIRSVVGRNCKLRDVVILGSDRFETPKDLKDNQAQGRPDLNIGDGSVVERAILDKDCRFGKGAKLINRDNKQEADGPNASYYIRDGIICIPRGAVIPDGAVV